MLALHSCIYIYTVLLHTKCSVVRLEFSEWITVLVLCIKARISLCATNIDMPSYAIVDDRTILCTAVHTYNGWPKSLLPNVSYVERRNIYAVFKYFGRMVQTSNPLTRSICFKPNFSVIHLKYFRFLIELSSFFTPSYSPGQKPQNKNM